MIKHLYDAVAKRWYHGGTIYFYGDPHFGDLECYKIRFPEIFSIESINRELAHNNRRLADDCKIDFSGIVTQLDQMQIDNINKVCGKNDTLVILGDVGDVECVKQLKAGYKVLIMGNHDKGASNYKRYVDFYDGEGDNHLFDEVYEGTLQIGPKLLLSHEPVDYPYCLNLHSHTHAAAITVLKEIIHFDHISYQYDCIAEKHDYKPINIKTLTETGLLKPIDDIHRVTINKAK